MSATVEDKGTVSTSTPQLSTEQENTYDVERAIQSFLKRGIISASKVKEANSDAKTSVDMGLSEVVSLNCISEPKGIRSSLLHKARGGVVVGIEETISDKQGILFKAVERRQEEIDLKKREVIEGFAPEFGFAPDDLVQQSAIQKILEEDELFIQSVSQKIHGLMLLIVDIPSSQEEINKYSGSAEMQRPSVAPEQIKHFILSDSHQEKLDQTSLANDSRVIFVTSKKIEELTFSYKDQWGNAKTIELKNIEIPDYERALLGLVNDGEKKFPLITHMTRL